MDAEDQLIRIHLAQLLDVRLFNSPERHAINEAVKLIDRLNAEIERLKGVNTLAEQHLTVIWSRLTAEQRHSLNRYFMFELEKGGGDGKN